MKTVLFEEGGGKVVTASLGLLSPNGDVGSGLLGTCCRSPSEDSADRTAKSLIETPHCMGTVIHTRASNNYKLENCKGHA